MGYFFFWSEHCSTTHHVLLLRLGTLLLFISPWPMRQSSDGSPSGRLRMGVRSLMMVNLVFHCISFHSNQLRTADLQKKKKKIGRAGFNLRENVKTSSTPQFSSSDQLLSHVQIFVTQWTAACQASLSITNSQSLLKLMSIESVLPSNHLSFCCPLLLLHSVFPSIRIFSNESVLCISDQSIGVSASASVLPVNIQD